jgi:hypothetical protein
MIPLNRHGPAVLIRKARRWLEPDLDPRRVGRVFEEFDDRGGYAAWHAQCKAALRRPQALPEAPGPVVRDGFVVKQAMSQEQAGELLAAVGALDGQGAERLKRDSAKLEGYPLDDPSLLRSLAQAALTSEIDAHCLDFFGSEYFVYWCTVSRTAPLAEGAPTVSFKWHCDRGPRAHLKLLVYLNDYREHGGGTSYLDLDASDAVARSGYLFARGKRRTGSIEELSVLAKRPLVAYDHLPRAGDAVLFQPSRVLHRGITPTRGPRYVLTLCLLPSPANWSEAMDRAAQIDLRHDPIWHGDARALRVRFA